MFFDRELKILDYNRVLKTYNGHTVEDILDEASKIFDITELDREDKHPTAKGEISMYINKNWYSLVLKDEYRINDPVRGLDVSRLQDLFLEPVFGIEDPKTDNNIDFVGGIRGIAELEKRCEEDAVVAFAMYPTSIDELFDVADAKLLMPPKSTWFEPKLRSGLFIHEI